MEEIGAMKLFVDYNEADASSSRLCNEVRIPFLIIVAFIYNGVDMLHKWRKDNFMKCSLQKIFELIDEKKMEEDFYYDLSGEFGTDYYFNLLTSYDPKGKVLLNADCRKKKICNVDIRFEEIDIDGILLYQYFSHDEDYKIMRVENFDKVMDVMYGDCGLLNTFIGDIVVIENGIKKRYYVKDADGNILNWEDIDRIKKQGIEMIIEWL